MLSQPYSVFALQSGVLPINPQQEPSRPATPAGSSTAMAVWNCPQSRQWATRYRVVQNAAQIGPSIMQHTRPPISELVSF